MGSVLGDDGNEMCGHSWIEVELGDFWAFGGGGARLETRPSFGVRYNMDTTTGHDSITRLSMKPFYKKYIFMFKFILGQLRASP